ncbi:MAG: RNA polymerase sigma-70 factor [Saprospiraceae bacterium]|nr:RNA polymerase sigma-70 factor [Saprospiraceae bacterium]
MDKANFKTYFDQYFNPIRNYIYYRCGDKELATDVAQETFMKLWEKRMKIQEHAIKGLLYKIASDLLISQLRKKTVAKRYQDTLRLSYIDRSTEESIEYQEVKHHYEKALAELPENQRSVFLMSRLDGMSYKEIAARLEISVKAIEKRMSKALSTLKARFKALGKI